MEIAAFFLLKQKPKEFTVLAFFIFYLLVAIIFYVNYLGQISVFGEIWNVVNPSVYKKIVFP